MDDSRILSAFSELPAGKSAAAARAGSAAQAAQAGERADARRAVLFDACHAGVVLRAVLFVEAVVWTSAMFGARDAADWFGRAAFLTGGALAATLAWLLAACSLKSVIARLPVLGQRAAGIVLGAFAGLFACALLALVGLAGPPPWIPGAIAGALIAAALVAALVWRARSRAPADTTARLVELQARIRPHFLFNTINSAIALVREDPARAEALLEDLADLFRQALAERRDSVTLAEEVALARRYLAIEQVRFGERLQVEWAIDPRADGARVPPLVLQPLVENAVKHGVEPSAEGAQVRISTERRGGSVVVKVTNTVPAGAGAPGHGVAQENVRERLSLLHDVHAQFQSGLRGNVYQVRLEVPA